MQSTGSRRCNYPVEGLKALIIKELKRNKIKFNIAQVPQVIDFKYFSKNSVLNYLIELAKNREGKLLSKAYLGGRYKLKWKCNQSHIWEATPENVIGSKAKEGTWCPKCASVSRGRKQADTIENINLFAKSKGGKCLSESYINAQQKLNWQCGKGHTWWANANSVKSGSWCPFCAGKIVTLDSINKWAATYSGKCISKSYKRNSLPLEWSCKAGHKWQMSLSKMQRRVKDSKFWCQYCRTR